MFGRKDNGDLPPLAKGADGDPWDPEVLQKLIAQDRLNFTLHHLEWRYREGPRPSGMGYDDKVNEVIGAGSVTLTQHIFVELTFQPTLDEMGIVAFDWQLSERWGDNAIAVPVLHVVLQDTDDRLKLEIREALRDAALSGLPGVEFRCMWNFPKGQRETTIDNRAVISGIYVWGQLHHPQLGAWLKPIGENDWSEHPEPWRLRRDPSKR